MSEMVNRLARGMAEAEGAHWDTASAPIWQLRARTVFTLIREPTPEQMGAGAAAYRTSPVGTTPGTIGESTAKLRCAYQAMIDAALPIPHGTKP